MDKGAEADKEDGPADQFTDQFFFFQEIVNESSRRQDREDVCH